jgi:hypothetical protein
MSGSRTCEPLALVADAAELFPASPERKKEAESFDAVA